MTTDSEKIRTDSEITASSAANSDRLNELHETLRKRAAKECEGRVSLASIQAHPIPLPSDLSDNSIDGSLVRFRERTVVTMCGGVSGMQCHLSEHCFPASILIRPAE